MQHAQLVRLQGAPKLEQLSIVTGTVCVWPAALACSLPGSLQKIRVCIALHDSRRQQLGPSGGCDLSAFHQAAGSPQLDVHVCGLWHSGLLRSAHAASILAGLSAAGAFHTLCLTTNMGFVSAHLAELSQLRCSRCVMQFRGGADIAVLPLYRHVSMAILVWAGPPGAQTARSPPCNCAALASPGVRCLGSAGYPLGRLVVRDCPGLPAHRQPWALAVWANMSTANGLPASCSVEEVPGLHVWRTAAGASLNVW